MKLISKISYLAIFMLVPLVPSFAQTTAGDEPEQLEQLLTPVALYPDQLLTQVLEASTYPSQIAEAEKWVTNPANAGLRADQAAEILQQAPWSPDVKSLTAYPQVLRMLSDNMSWTEHVGIVFLTQQADVMDAVQELRQSAEDAGTLSTTDQVTVTHQGRDIVIVPTYPESASVPAFNPETAYGGWGNQVNVPYNFRPVYAPTPVYIVVAPTVVRPFRNVTVWDWQRRYVNDRRMEQIKQIRHAEPTPHYRPDATTRPYDPAVVQSRPASIPQAPLPATYRQDPLRAQPSIPAAEPTVHPVPQPPAAPYIEPQVTHPSVTLPVPAPVQVPVQVQAPTPVQLPQPAAQQQHQVQPQPQPQQVPQPQSQPVLHKDLPIQAPAKTESEHAAKPTIQNEHDRKTDDKDQLPHP